MEGKKQGKGGRERERKVKSLKRLGKRNKGKKRRSDDVFADSVLAMTKWQHCVE
jgi:hypothetical protein